MLAQFLMLFPLYGWKAAFSLCEIIKVDGGRYMKEVMINTKKYFCLALMLMLALAASAAAQIKPSGKVAPGSISLKVDTRNIGSAHTTLERFNAIAVFATPISIKLADADATVISNELSNQTGYEIKLTPARPSDIIVTFDINMVPLRDILHFLSDNFSDAKLTVGGYDYRDLENERFALYSLFNAEFEIHAVDVPLRIIVGMISPLSARKLKVDVADEEKHVTIHATGITVPALIKRLAAETNSKIQY
jgi:hypothetical protein